MEAAGFVSCFGEEKLGTGELLNLCELSHPLCFPTEVWGGFPEAGRCFFSSELLFTLALSAGFYRPCPPWHCSRSRLRSGTCCRLG